MQIRQIETFATEEPFVQVLGSRIHLVTTTRAVSYMERWINMRDGQCRRVVATGFHGIWEGYKNPGFRSVLNSAELWVPDGIAPVLAALAHGHPRIARAPGAEIMREFFARADEKGYSSYLYGDTERTLCKLQQILLRDYPGHKIVGAFSPPFRPLTPAEDCAIVDQINAAQPDVLWVALGMPKQDIWIHERLKRLNVPVAVGVGAAFGFVAGIVPRCPDWIGHNGFEWLYRFFKEPRKLWRRDLLDGPRFLFHFGRELIRNGRSD